MAKLETFEFDDPGEREWDELVLDSPYGTIFQRYFWLKLCEKHFGGKLRIIGVERDGELVGGCSLFERRTRFGRRHADSICCLDPYGSVLVSKDYKEGGRLDRSCEHVVKALTDMFREMRLSKVRIVNSPDLVDVRPFTWNGWNSSVMYAYYVPLENNSFSRTVRRGVKKAEELGYQIGHVPDHVPDIDTVQRMLQRTYDEDGVDVKVPEGFLHEAVREIQTRDVGMVNAIASPEGELACASIFLWDEKRPYYWVCVNDADTRESGARFMLDLEAFSEMEEKGFGEVNMMSGNLPRLAEFAMNYRPLLIPYFSNCWNLKF